MVKSFVSPILTNCPSYARLHTNYVMCNQNAWFGGLVDGRLSVRTHTERHTQILLNQRNSIAQQYFHKFALSY